MDNLFARSRQTGLTILALVALISFKLLLVGNLGTGAQNEGDVLPLARQYADPTWVPTDWYLNQPPGYRWLFSVIFGNLMVAWGFLATSIIGRLLCYSLFSWGLVRIGRKIGLSLPGLLLVIYLLLYTGRQSVAAREWMLGGLEAKSVAYGLVVLAIALLLEGRYLWMALLLGLATSFHVLVGGWAFLTTVIWLGLGRRLARSQWGWMLTTYLVASALVIGTVGKQLFTPTPAGTVLPSCIYVFWRLPHHLDPVSWNSDWWVRPVIYLLLMLLALGWLWHNHKSKQSAGRFGAQLGLANFALISLMPFVLGLAIAPFDTQGRWLQYYLFRFGDVMLPLSACLLVVCAIEQGLSGRWWRRIFIVGCALVLVITCNSHVGRFQKHWVAVQQFPGKAQGVDPDLKDFYTWIRGNTAKDAIIVSAPTYLYNLTWVTERATIAKYKFLPQDKADILGWYERLSDLSGSVSPWPTSSDRKDKKERIRQALAYGYNHLTTSQAEALMQKYQATYLATVVEHSLSLPVAYRNARYVLYQKR